MNKKYLETIKALDGKLFHLEYHQERLDLVLKDIKATATYSLRDLLSPPPSSLYRCRILYSADSFEVEYIPYVKREIKTLKLVYDDAVAYSKKYENREAINKLFLKKESCDDILIVKNGLITDTSIANVAFYDGTLWITPSVPLLKGTTRERLLKEGKIEQNDIKVEDINKFTKVAVMNAMVDFDIIAEENIREIIC